MKAVKYDSERKPEGPLRSIFAGICSSLATNLVTHPLEVVRTRRHARGATADYGGDLRELATVVRTEGFAGLYRGSTIHFFGHITSGIVYFAAESVLRSAVFRRFGPPVGAVERVTRRVLTSSTAGFIQNRAQLRRGKKTAFSGSNLNPIAQLVDLARTEGLPGLYAGLWPSLILTVHSSVQYALYDELKRGIVNAKGGRPLSALDRFVAGSISRGVAVVASNPVQMVRVRLMEENSGYKTATEAALSIWKDEGPLAFFRGTSAALWKVLAGGISMPVYDIMVNATKHWVRNAHRHHNHNLRF